MALTIHPAVGGPGKAWLLVAAAYSAGVVGGAMASAAAVAAVVTVAGGLVGRTATALALAGLVLVAMLREGGISVPLPYRSRQVPEWWRDALSPRVVAFAFGVLLGFGFVTPFTTAAHLGFLMTTPYLPSLPAMLLCVVCFAFGKTLVLQLGAGATSHDEVVGRISTRESSGRARAAARRLVGIGAAALAMMAVLQEVLGKTL